MPATLDEFCALDELQSIPDDGIGVPVAKLFG